MPTSEASRRYKKKNVRRYCIDFNKKTEGALVDRMERARLQEGGYAAYVKKLITDDIDKDSRKKK